MLYYFKKGKNATEMHKKICAVYGEDPVTDWTCQKWLAKFRVGDFLLDNAPQSGRRVEVDSYQIETIIENNQCYTMREIADILKISKSSTENHLHQLGYVHHFDVWVPHKLSEKNLLDHISTCHSLLKCNENVLFLKQLWQTKKSGHCTKMWYRRDHGASEMNHCQPHQRPVFIQRRWCCVRGGIGREFSIMSSFRKTKWLIPTSTAPS